MDPALFRSVSQDYERHVGSLVRRLACRCKRPPNTASGSFDQLMILCGRSGAV